MPEDTLARRRAKHHAARHVHHGADELRDPLNPNAIPSLPTSKITFGQFPLTRMPRGTDGHVLTARGLYSDPIYAPGGGGGATYVVAASNAHTKKGADYVCDGVNDDVEIQAAVDALGGTGGVVLLTDGTFLPSTHVIISGSYKAIRGFGSSTIVRRHSDYTLKAFDFTGGVQLALSDMYLQNCEVSLNAILRSRISNLQFWNYSGGAAEGHHPAIRITGASERILITNNIIVTDWRFTLGADLGRSLHVTDSSRIFFIGNLIDTNTKFYGISVFDLTDSLIANNEIVGSDRGIFVCYASLRNRIMGNRIAGYLNYGIRLKHPGEIPYSDTYPEYTLIKGNLFNSATGTSIYDIGTYGDVDSKSIIQENMLVPDGGIFVDNLSDGTLLSCNVE